MIYIANPNNPTGTYLNVRDVERLLKGLPRDVLVIMDEAYYEYARYIEDYPDTCRGPLKKNVIVLRAFPGKLGYDGFGK